MASLSEKYETEGFPRVCVTVIAKYHNIMYWRVYHGFNTTQTQIGAYNMHALKHHYYFQKATNQ